MREGWLCVNPLGRHTQAGTNVLSLSRDASCSPETIQRRGKILQQNFYVPSDVALNWNAYVKRVINKDDENRTGLVAHDYNEKIINDRPRVSENAISPLLNLLINSRMQIHHS